MKQVIRKGIINKYDIKTNEGYILVCDGNSILKTALVSEKLNEDQEDYGPVVTFFTIIKKIISMRDFKHCFLFWDDKQSGVLRAQIYPAYKANRGKNYDITEGMSDYMKEYTKKLKSMQEYIYSKSKSKTDKEEEEEERFRRSKETIVAMAEELFFRQYECEGVEGDDLIAECVHKFEGNHNVVIISADRDLVQLINENVCIYDLRLKKTLTQDNCLKELGYSNKAVVQKKIFCGDTSDNIKGIKGLGEKTFFECFPKTKLGEMTTEDIIKEAQYLNEQRIKLKKKPLKVFENIVNKITDGVQGKDIYEINKKIIDLSEPLLTDEAKENMIILMESPLSKDDRTFENLYNIVQEKKIMDLIESDKFGNFFSSFAKLIDFEKKFEEC